MARRKDPVAPELPKLSKAQPLLTYGCTTPPEQVPIANKQFFYDSYAFAWRVPIDNGAPPRGELFKRLTRVICPEWFEWHTWTDRMVDACCSNMWIGMAGCCVSGDTRIINPITGGQPTIRELFESKTAPVVMTLEGPRQASVPFIKGREELFEVKLSNGSRFVATAGHRVAVLRSNRSVWCRVGELQPAEYLLAYGTNLQGTSLEPGRLAHELRADYSPKTTVDAQADCFPWKVEQTEVASIKSVGQDTYYDLCVPGPEHYFAEGLIHHNSSAGKTHNAVGFACTWWMANPQESSVILCSTTAKAMRKRAWAEVQKFHTSIPGPRCGHFVDSQMIWKANAKDDRHAITGIAVEEGGTAKVADNIKGVHTKRQLVMIDEGTAVSPAIFDACTNLFSYPAGYPNGEFILMILGNPRTRLDEFGKFCEPVNGWNSVTVEDEEWETKPQINGRSGVVVRFDAEKSPNIITGQIVSKHLPTKATVDEWRSKAGSQDDPRYWSNQRGFFPPEGLVKSVFTESALLVNDAFGKLHFTGRNFRIIAAFDPARTGDHPTLRFGALGEIEGGIWGLEALDPVVIPISANSTNPIDFQLLEQVRREFERVKYRGTTYACTPDCFGVDATGGGADLCDIFQRHWSPRVMRVIFSASASTEQVSHEDVRLACDVYRNKRVEMYFRARKMSDAKQLKGLDKETGKELCTIIFDDSKPLITLIDKKDYRKQYGKSPDNSDSLVILCEVAARLGFRLVAQGQTVDRKQALGELVQQAQSVYDPEDSHTAEELEEYS